MKEKFYKLWWIVLPAELRGSSRQWQTSRQRRKYQAAKPRSNALSVKLRGSHAPLRRTTRSTKEIL